MKMSDIITQTIIKMLDESTDNKTEIQRNEFAEMMGCVPSQINYVLSSRFTPEQGYMIESYRGGGGYIRITRVKLDQPTAIMHIVNSIGNSIDSMSARIVIENCLRTALISKEAAKIMSATVSNGVMSAVPINSRDEVRAAIIKQILLTQI
ncbi:MAG: CtsR family transcriptional regulator [Ruminococcaceae bacterium]|nr:CtsR family transcriptional regulator [Oscillospiraceae bacterium]